MLEKLYESISSEILTDDVKLQMATLFESAVNEAITAKEKSLEEQNQVEVSQFKESLTNQVSEYLDYFVEEFVQENEESIDESVKINVACKVLESFDSLVEGFSKEISEEKLEESSKLEELTAEVNKLHTKVLESRGEVQSVRKTAMVLEACQELETDVEVDELVHLAKTVEFDDIFESKLQVFIEQIISARTSKQSKEKLVENIDEGFQVKQDTPAQMEKYLKYL